MKASRILTLLWLTGTGSLLAGQPALALDDDRQQPIRITADSAVREEQLGQTEYSGNVVLIQGSLVIRASTLTLKDPIEGDPGSVITALGDPATLEQTPREGDVPVTAEAGKIVYEEAFERIRLTEDARLEQNGAVVSGAVIDYLVNEQRVKAVGDESGEGQRVEVVIPPSTFEAEN